LCAYLFGFAANMRRCITDHSEPMYWSKFEKYLSKYHSETFDDVLKWKLAPLVEKSWLFKSGRIQSVVSFDQLKRAALWAEPECGNFGVVCFLSSSSSSSQRPSLFLLFLLAIILPSTTNPGVILKH